MTPLANLLDSGVSRRRVFSAIARATLGVTAAEAVFTGRADARGPTSTANIITLFLAGGLSHIDTFDPKPGREEQGPTGVIGTNVPGTCLGDGLERLATMADRLAIVRSVHTRTGDHTDGQYVMRTSYRPTNVVRHPAVGSWALKTSEYDGDLPGYVLVGDGNVHPGAGFLGPAYAPISVIDPTSALPRGVTETDLHKRLLIATHVDNGFRKRYHEETVSAYDAMYARTVRLVGSKDTKAFDVSSEPDSVKERYGRTVFAKGCLLARRLVEAGVPFVDVDGDPGWDMHSGMFAADSFPMKIREFDMATSALLDDLEGRGLLETTLVVIATEFGRTPLVNAAGGRGHHPSVFSCVLAGAGVKRGVVHGSSDERAYALDSDGVSVPDFNTTIAAAAGLPYETDFRAPNGRPFRIGGEGKPVTAILA